jgi:four helix bundle protein
VKPRRAVNHAFGSLETWLIWGVRTSDQLRNRTKEYASLVVGCDVKLPKNREEVRVIGHQMLRSGTSVAANFREASRARSVAEFISKLETCIQEADETDLWLELLRDDCRISAADLEKLLVETNELISIFITMAKRSKAKAD